MVSEKCVKMGKKLDRPILHRKTGTIGVANLHRRKMLSSPLATFPMFKSCVDSSNPAFVSKQKHVRWAKPIAQVHTVIVPPVGENIAQPDEGHMDLQSALNSLLAVAKPLNLTPYFCLDCQQYYSSQSKLNRHKGTQKHQQQAILQSGFGATKSNHAQLECASQIKKEVADTEVDTPFYCIECDQSYKNRKHLNRHKKTGKHLDNVHIKVQMLQTGQQAELLPAHGTFLDSFFEFSL